MTALNAYVGREASHVFTDVGSYRTDGLKIVGKRTKVLPLIGLIGVLAWSGPIDLGFQLTQRIEQKSPRDLWDCAEISFRSLRQIPYRYSILLVSASLGLALQEGDQIHQLHVGDSIQSIPTDIMFDPMNIEQSGLEMMRDQRKSGVVYGWCQHTAITLKSISSTILERWDV